MSSSVAARLPGHQPNVVPLEEWSALFDNSPVALACVSPALRLTRVNGAFASLCQAMAGRLLGRYCYEVFGEPSAETGIVDPSKPCSSCPALACMRTGRVQQFGRRFRQGVFRVIAAPVRDSVERARGAILMVTDATVEQDLRRQLVHAQKLAAVGLMTAGVAHELKNPLTSIEGYAKLLGRCRGLSDEAKAHIGRIVTEAQRCGRIVTNLLKFTRQEGRGRVVADLTTVVRESLDLLRYQLSTSGIEIHEDYAPTALPTLGDPYELRQVVHNLVQNAFDAMREANGGGKLLVATRQEGDHVIAEFEDTGPGLDDPNEIFEPFYTTKGVGQGTGLGLGISRSIVEEHDGTLSAETASSGALFRIELPCAQPLIEAPVSSP